MFWMHLVWPTAVFCTGRTPVSTDAISRPVCQNAPCPRDAHRRAADWSREPATLNRSRMHSISAGKYTFRWSPFAVRLLPRVQSLNVMVIGTVKQYIFFSHNTPKKLVLDTVFGKFPPRLWKQTTICQTVYPSLSFYQHQAQVLGRLKTTLPISFSLFFA